MPRRWNEKESTDLSLSFVKWDPKVKDPVGETLKLNITRQALARNRRLVAMAAPQRRRGRGWEWEQPMEWRGDGLFHLNL
jgi:hypothetical protein